MIKIKKEKSLFIPRIYQNIINEKNKNIILNKKYNHYILNVLRMKEEGIVKIFNNTNQIFHTKIKKINKKNIFLEIFKKKKEDKESKLYTHLGQIITNFNKFNFVLEKSTELGISAITPIISKNIYSNISKKKFEKKMIHWKNILISSCSQSGRNKIPKIYFPITISEWYNSIPKEHTKLVFHIKSQCFFKKTKEKNIWFLIGSEKGFSNSEIDFFSKKKFKSLSLGPRTLRSETAAISALTIIQLQNGDLN